MNKEKYLPIGSVVLLKGAKKRIMITGFVVKGKESGEKVYDYMGCLFPEGVISSDKNLLFNHDQIDKLYYIGYSDNDEKEFKIKLADYVSKNNVGEVPTNEQQTVTQTQPVVEQQVTPTVEQQIQDVPSALSVANNSAMTDLLTGLPNQ